MELLYGEEEVKNFEMENKKIMDNNTTNTNPNQMTSTTNNGKMEKLLDVGEKKKKSKKTKKESNNNNNNNVPNVKSQEVPKSVKNKSKVEKKETSKSVVANTNTNNTTSVNFLSKNIFAVCGGTKNSSSINALKCDSSDDENNVIIQENDNININNINYNNEDGFEEEEI